MTDLNISYIASNLAQDGSLDGHLLTTLQLNPTKVDALFKELFGQAMVPSDVEPLDEHFGDEEEAEEFAEQWDPKGPSVQFTNDEPFRFGVTSDGPWKSMEQLLQERLQAECVA